jgi:hypothetical protein
VRFPNLDSAIREAAGGVIAGPGTGIEHAVALAFPRDLDRGAAVHGSAPALPAPPCFECGSPSEHGHHVVPRSLGGTRTVPLCLGCHGNARGRSKAFRNTAELTKAALAAKRTRGERAGTVPWGWQLAADRK